MNFIEFDLVGWVGNVISSEFYIHAELQLLWRLIRTDNQQTIMLTLVLTSTALLELYYTKNNCGINETIWNMY
jgi:hypothetical protein